jgi:hypothetical protein
VGAEEGSVLRWGEGGEAVEAEGEGFGCRVVLADEAGVREEDPQAQLVFVARVDQVVLAEVSDEGFLFVGLEEGRGKGGGDECEEQKLWELKLGRI